MSPKLSRSTLRSLPGPTFTVRTPSTIGALNWASYPRPHADLNSIPQWRVRPPRAPLWYHTGGFPRRHVPLPDIPMGSSRISKRGAIGLRDPDGHYASAPRAAR